MVSFGYELHLWHWKGSWILKFMPKLLGSTKWRMLSECREQSYQPCWVCFVTAGPPCPPQASDRQTHTSYTYGMWFPVGKASGRPIVASLAYWAAVCLITCHLFLGSAVSREGAVMESRSGKEGRHRAQGSSRYSAYSRVSWSMCFDDFLDHDSGFSHWCEKLLSMQSRGMLVIVLLV